jgi:hypothetical protein
MFGCPRNRVNFMKRLGSSWSALVALALVGCAQLEANRTIGNTASCLKEALVSPDGQIVYARLWINDETDTADKLTDNKPLSQSERNALVRINNKIRSCRDIIIAHDNRFAAWETPYWQEFFQRGDAIFYKLASGEIAVGAANKLTIESIGKFQTDVSRGHADAVRIEDAQRQRAAEAMLQTSAQILASQPRPQMTTTNCSWLGNNLNCTSFR